MAPKPWILIPALCLVVTGADVVRADDAQSTSRWGVTLRGGSVAGYTQLRGEEVTTVGLQLGLGYQIGPLAIEAEHERAMLLEKNEGTARGGVTRSAVNLRVYALNLHRFQSRSMLRLYVELGGGRSGGDYGSGDPFSRLDTSAGAGFLLDHRALMANVGAGGLRFAGWHLGWSVRGSEVAEMSPSFAASCNHRTSRRTCPAPDPTERSMDLSLMVTSSLSFNW